jgi:hypothetical protein
VSNVRWVRTDWAYTSPCPRGRAPIGRRRSSRVPVAPHRVERAGMARGIGSCLSRHTWQSVRSPCRLKTNRSAALRGNRWDRPDTAWHRYRSNPRSGLVPAERRRTACKRTPNKSRRHSCTCSVRWRRCSAAPRSYRRKRCMQAVRKGKQGCSQRGRYHAASRSSRAHSRMSNRPSGPRPSRDSSFLVWTLACSFDIAELHAVSRSGGASCSVVSPTCGKEK